MEFQLGLSLYRMAEYVQILEGWHMKLGNESFAKKEKGVRQTSWSVMLRRYQLWSWHW